MNDGFFNVLDGWIGKAVFSVVAFGVAWFTRRPAERASIMLAVDKRVATAMEALERQLTAAHNRCDDLAAQHEACEVKLASFREEIDALMRGPVAEYNTITRPKP